MEKFRKQNMVKQIFVNLPVNDLVKSKDFYRNLGFSINEQLEHETSATVIVSDDIYITLLNPNKFGQLKSKKISNPKKTPEVINALSVDSRDEVNKLVDVAIASGGTEVRPTQDHGFMYGRAFNDLDGHIWEVFWMGFYLDSSMQIVEFKKL